MFFFHIFKSADCSLLVPKNRQHFQWGRLCSTSEQNWLPLSLSLWSLRQRRKNLSLADRRKESLRWVSGKIVGRSLARSLLKASVESCEGRCRSLARFSILRRQRSRQLSMSSSAALVHNQSYRLEQSLARSLALGDSERVVVFVVSIIFNLVDSNSRSLAFIRMGLSYRSFARDFHRSKMGVEMEV